MLSGNMGIPRTSELSCYLGHQLIHMWINNSGHNRLLQKVKRMLDGWKASCLSWAGQITLAQSMLSSMSVFHMQLQKLPSRIYKESDKSVKQCVWGLIAAKRQIHLLRWDVFCRRKERGGVGLKKSEVMNKAFLAKLA